AKAPVKKAAKPVAKAAPVAKKVAKTPAPTKKAASAKQEAARPATTRSPFAPRPVGKVAVAVVSRAPAPPPKTKYKVVPYKTDEATGRPILPKDHRPGADEEYMSPLQLEYFRQRLLQWRADLVEESKQTIENLKEDRKSTRLN